MELFFNKRFSQNYIIRRPLPGSLILTLFSFSFLYLYRPLNPMDNKIVSYEWAMFIYSLVSGTFGFVAINLLKKINYFTLKDHWTLLKELLFILCIIPGMGFMVYLSGFIVERGSPNFLVSLRDTFLIAILPFSFFTMVNIHSLFAKSRYRKEGITEQDTEKELPVIIKSQLKNEELHLSFSELLYAESDGNYVIFYLLRENTRIEKKIIRNTITDVERQLKKYPQIVRTHRAFLVNLEKICKKEGNVSGYSLKLTGTDKKIPVSRQNTAGFIKKYTLFSS